MILNMDKSQTSNFRVKKFRTDLLTILEVINNEECISQERNYNNT